MPVFENTIRNTITVGETQIFNQSLLEYAKYSDVAADYRKVCKELIKKVGV